MPQSTNWAFEIFIRNIDIKKKNSISAKMWIVKFYVHFIILTLLAALSTSHKKDDRFYYLNQQRPLWILKDQVSSKERDSILQNKIRTNDKLENPNHFYLSHRSRRLFPFAESSPKRIDLPKNYIYAGRYNYSHFNAQKRNIQRQRIQPIIIPISRQSTVPRYELDSNDDVLDPIFIFNKRKDGVILNTMLRKQKISLPEPVPGEILNPPTAPLFHPNSIVQRYRIPGHETPKNLTLIPFYAHEAIIPHYPSEAIETKTSILYAAQAPSRSTTTSPMSTTFTSKKHRFKKAKQYTVYRSPDDVHWSPNKDGLFKFSDSTTAYPTAIASPLGNHRYNDESFDTSTTIKPSKNSKLSNNDEDSQFRIVYVEESIESPVSREVTTTESPRKRLDGIKYSKPLPVLSSHYLADKNYYAFPVYTLGNLLKSDTVAKPKNFSPDCSKPDGTWFILNSRYKGRQGRDGSHRLSSKYIKVPWTTKESLIDESAETTLEKSIIP